MPDPLPSAPEGDGYRPSGSVRRMKCATPAGTAQDVRGKPRPAARGRSKRAKRDGDAPEARREVM
jgi:hypothetical protein